MTSELPPSIQQESGVGTKMAGERKRRFPALLRRQVFQRDRGVCAQCGLDTEQLRRELLEVTPDQRARREAELGWPSHRMDFWDADHVTPFAEGGPCTMENLRTLCLGCHKARPSPLGKSSQLSTAKARGVMSEAQTALQPGYWVALTISEGAAPLRCYVGQVQAIDKRGVRLTLIDWLLGSATGWDFFAPWTIILSALVATPEHDLDLFLPLNGGAAPKWQQAFDVG